MQPSAKRHTLPSMRVTVQQEQQHTEADSECYSVPEQLLMLWRQQRDAEKAHDFSTTGVQVIEPVKRALFMPPNCTSPAGSAAGLGFRYTAKVGASMSCCVIMLKNTGSVRMFDSWGKPRPCSSTMRPHQGLPGGVCR